MVKLGILNSRMKDFFDLALLARQFDFDGAILVRAVRAMFKRRKTPLPIAVPVGLTEEFATDRMKASQWRAFLSKTGTNSAATLPEVISENLCLPSAGDRSAPCKDDLACALGQRAVHGNAHEL